MDFLKALLYYQMNKRSSVQQKSRVQGHIMEYLEDSKNQKRYYLLKYSFEMGILPTTDLSEIYSYDYETLYSYFASKYNLTKYE